MGFGRGKIDLAATKPHRLKPVLLELGHACLEWKDLWKTRQKIGEENPRRSHDARNPARPSPALHLLSDAEMRRIAEKIFKFSDADETEVEIGAVTDALTRFANNTIHQNVAEQVARRFGAHRARRPHGARDHQQDG